MKTLLTDVDYLVNVIGGNISIHMDDKYIAIRQGNELEKALENIHKLYDMLQGELVDDRYVI